MRGAAGLLAACLLRVVLLAGCSGGTPDIDEPPLASPSTTGPTTPPPPPPPAVFTGTCQANSGVAYGIPSVGSSGQWAECPFAQIRGGDLSLLQSGVVELAWTPGPTVMGAQLLIQSDSCWQGTRVSASGNLESNQCDQGNTGARPVPCGSSWTRPTSRSTARTT